MDTSANIDIKNKVVCIIVNGLDKKEVAAHAKR